MRSIAGIFLALAPVTAANAQRRKANVANDEVMEARRACFAEAKARVPGSVEHTSGLAPLRENAYRDCAHRKGVRP
jgi:hypothetical protein